MPLYSYPDFRACLEILIHNFRMPGDDDHLGEAIDATACGAAERLLATGLDLRAHMPDLEAAVPEVVGVAQDHPAFQAAIVEAFKAALRGHFQLEPVAAGPGWR